MPPAIHRPDRRAAWMIFLITFICYSYFFQGIGWNQMAHFATIRSLAEHGTAEISRFTDLTQDITVTPHGVFSTKSPGFALLGVPPYFLLITLERFFSIDFNATRTWLINMHVITMLLCSLPGAALNVLIFFAFRRENASLRTAMLLAGAFAFGSLSWPYSGVLMVHMLSAALLFAVWYLLTQPTLSSRHILAAGALLGVGILSDILVAPNVVVFAIYLAVRRISPRQWLIYALGPGAGILLTLLYNRLAHGSALASGPFHPIATFTAPGLLFGEFGWPEWIRLYWITYQPMRGLLPCCPIFILCLLALFLIRRPMRFSLPPITILLIFAGYIAFYLSFIGWTGGWSVGPRYMIPALPLLWIFALKPFLRFPKIGRLSNRPLDLQYAGGHFRLRSLPPRPQFKRTQSFRPRSRRSNRLHPGPHQPHRSGPQPRLPPRYPRKTPTDPHFLAAPHLLRIRIFPPQRIPHLNPAPSPLAV